MIPSSPASTSHGVTTCSFTPPTSIAAAPSSSIAADAVAPAPERSS